MSRVLIVEDDRRLSTFLTKGLRSAGFTTTACYDGTQAVALATDDRFDLIVLDIGLPGLDGFAVLRHVRTRGHSVPVVVLTGHNEVAETISALDSGADDYLTKPFEFSELTARLRALLRRSGGPGSPAVLRAGDLEMDPATREVRRGGDAVELTPKEFALLEFLLRNVDRPLSRATLMEHVWGIRFDPGTNIVDVCINSLRNKLQDRDRGLIQTVRGVGYVVRNPEKAE